jgi:putative phosphoribosyl transferase
MERAKRARTVLSRADSLINFMASQATGPSMLAAIRSVRARNPQKLIMAIGVAPPHTLARSQAEADEVLCLAAPSDFYAGQFFDDFSEVTDDMVVTALSRPARAA